MIEKINEVLLQPLKNKSRLVLLIVTFGVAFSYFLPVWKFTLVAPQYPEGLELSVYLYKITGGENDKHIEEINILNHYIGMQTLNRENLKDLDWIPFAVGLLIIFGLRMALIGNLKALLDIVMFSVYLTVFAAARFIYTLYVFGHNLNPEAPVDVEPFMPVIIGSKQIANFTTYSYPNWGSLFLGLFVCVMVVVFVWEMWVSLKKESQ